MITKPFITYYRFLGLYLVVIVRLAFAEFTTRDSEKNPKEIVSYSMGRFINSDIRNISPLSTGIKIDEVFAASGSPSRLDKDISLVRFAHS